jgi:hypothetical protein
MTQQSSLFLAFMYASFFLARRGQKKKMGEDKGRGIFKNRGIDIKVSSLSSMEYDMVRIFSRIA